ncbi:hydroxyethylthiazole kinase [Alkalibacterium iburiense]|uniref:Hydroxyethylthiazole kinase n=1 Tax=Alkalibacterium iburiense TaxID=290589 RepID=A0ABN0XL88_9LACT
MNPLLIESVRTENPLVHNMTNQVVANDVANTLLAIGASPIMAYAKEEVEDIVQVSKALVLNIGTITREVAESMKVAGKKANELGIPVVLDPVGVGATSFRQQIVKELFDDIQFTLIRGNSAEIARLAGVEWEARGVDAKEGTASREEMAQALAKEKECIVAISGKEDVISDGVQTVKVTNGHELLGRITGSGCMLSSVCGAFIGVNPTEAFQAVVTAHTAFAVSGEQAGKSSQVKGPGTFKPVFHDALAQVTAEDLSKEAKEETIEHE